MSCAVLGVSLARAVVGALGRGAEKPGCLGGPMLVDVQQLGRPPSAPDRVRVSAHVVELVQAGHGPEFRPLDGQKAPAYRPFIPLYSEREKGHACDARVRALAAGPDR